MDRIVSPAMLIKLDCYRTQHDNTETITRVNLDLLNEVLSGSNFHCAVFSFFTFREPGLGLYGSVICKEGQKQGSVNMYRDIVFNCIVKFVDILNYIYFSSSSTI